MLERIGTNSRVNVASGFRLERINTDGCVTLAGAVEERVITDGRVTAAKALDGNSERMRSL